jgi:hypothetical protein
MVGTDSDLELKMISEAISARNYITHSGQYYDRDNVPNESLVSLWDHAMLVRELVVRFILTAIDYRGPYCTYIGGFKNAAFPPAPGK